MPVLPWKLLIHLNRPCSQECELIATQSGCFNKADSDFIAMEIGKLQKDGIIQPSMSPWCAQVVVVVVVVIDKTKKHKKDCVDYSQTINIYTELDAFPLPKISDLVTNLARYKYFSSFDLKSGDYQIRSKQSDRKYTTFEGNGQLFEFTCILFGVTFLRSMNEIVKEENLTDTFLYLDNILVK